MEQPLGRKATAEDREQASREMCEEMRSPYVNYLAYANRDLLFAFAVQYDVFPNRVNGRKYITVNYGDHSQDLRVVPIKEHENREEAVAFALVLAITARIEYVREQKNTRRRMMTAWKKAHPAS